VAVILSAAKNLSFFALNVVVIPSEGSAFRSSPRAPAWVAAPWGFCSCSRLALSPGRPLPLPEDTQAP